MGIDLSKKVWRWEVVAGLCLTHGLRRGAELGVSQGRFTSFLCSVMRDMEIVAVDLWAPQEDRPVEGSETYENWPHERNFQHFRAHCEQHFPGRVTIIRNSTAEAAKAVEDESLDFVFIDADHTEEGARRDIALWTPKVRSGGLISGHDYNWPSVRRAVDEGEPVFVGFDNVWWRFKP